MSSLFSVRTADRTDSTGRWRGWAVASTVYLLAVLHRTSLGVAGLRAESRFHITPAQLGIFVFIQLGVYAAMQVPTGLLVDRYGPKRLLTLAAGLMGCAQLLFATVPSYPVALAARALLGCGDALTFVSVLRFAAGSFSPRRYPLLVALTALCGTLGNVAATLPLALALRRFGWASTFTVAAVASLLAAIAVIALVPDRPPERDERHAETGVTVIRRRVAAAWAIPGTRVGFWLHFSCMSTTTAFAVLWGGPYLIKAAGFSTTGAGAVLMSSVIFAALFTPPLGALIGRRPVLRTPIALTVSVSTIAGWVVLVAALGDHPPRAYVAVLFVLMAVGGPVSMAAFSVVRDYNSAATLGTASGLVNVGGFTATIVIVLGFGWAVDLLGGTTPHALRMAALVAVAVQTLGAMRLWTWVRRARASSLERLERGEPVPVPIVRRRWDLAPPAAALDQQVAPI
jgi:predicted MFS family arabinose efflux permease